MLALTDIQNTFHTPCCHIYILSPFTISLAALKCSFTHRHHITCAERHNTNYPQFSNQNLTASLSPKFLSQLTTEHRLSNNRNIQEMHKHPQNNQQTHHRNATHNCTQPETYSGHHSTQSTFKPS
jgi:hypothetical protein